MKKYRVGLLALTIVAALSLIPVPQPVMKVLVPSACIARADGPIGPPPPIDYCECDCCNSDGCVPCPPLAPPTPQCVPGWCPGQ